MTKQTRLKAISRFHRLGQQNRRLSVFSLFFVCLSSVLFGPPSRADSLGRPDVGHVQELRNQAQANYQGHARTLTLQAAVKLQDRLTTARDSRLKILLKDGSSVQLGEQAELLVDQFVYAPQQGSEMVLSALKGALRFVGKKRQGAARRDAVQIKTPVANLGVRGTDFWVGPIDGATGVLVLQGKVQISNTFGLVGLGPGEGAMVQDNGQLGPRKKWSDAKQRRALRMVAFP